MFDSVAASHIEDVVSDQRLTETPANEGRKRVIGIMAVILASLQTICSVLPKGSPRTDRLIAASIQWAERIMEKVDAVQN